MTQAVFGGSFQTGRGEPQGGGLQPCCGSALRLAVALCVAASLLGARAGELARHMGDLPEGMDPGTISRRITDQFLTTRPENYKPAGYHGNGGYGWNRIVQYSVVSTWLNGLTCAQLTKDDYRKNRLIGLFEDFLPYHRLHRIASRPWHVDDTIFGALPLEIYLANGDLRCRDMGLFYADNQWCAPCEESFKERESAPPDVQRVYYNEGYSVQTRLWIDDMYMITVLQSQAYRVTKDRKYIERAAKEMCFYLDRLQLAEGPAKGLFYHAPDVPYVWGRGDGWMAAGMALVLDRLPADSPHRARILAGYRQMMATLLKYQRADGLWCQLVDRPGDARNWGETSCTAMFAYAYMVGLRRGWLDGDAYGPAVRKAYLALCARMDAYGNVSDCCEGTGKRNDLPYYFARRRVNGDPHVQAPMLWIATVLLEEGVGLPQGIRTPATSKLFERRVDPVSGVVSYALCHGKPTDNRQSLYFTIKSMTDDGRYLVFNYTRGNERIGRGPRQVCVADLLAEKVFELPGFAFLETRRNYMIGCRPETGFWRMDLASLGRADAAVRLCETPSALTRLGKVVSLASHLSLTKDREKAFLDAHVRQTASGSTNVTDVYVQGLLTLTTGAFEEWNRETGHIVNHGQLCPADDRLALCAWEAAWEKPGRDYQAKTGWYPRMWLVEPGKATMIPARDRNFASHEVWDDDGRGFSWCGRGRQSPGDYVYHHDLATGRQERICGVPGARHNTLSPDKRYVVCDDAPSTWWRGCSWRVAFWNRETNRGVWVYSTRPALCPREKESRLHPDPHPQFVCRGKYIVSTANNADGHMDLYVTPVAPLVEMTAQAAPNTFGVDGK